MKLSHICNTLSKGSSSSNYQLMMNKTTSQDKCLKKHATATTISHRNILFNRINSETMHRNRINNIIMKKNFHIMKNKNLVVMTKSKYEGDLDANSLNDRFGIVVSKFNSLVTKALLEGCIEAFKKFNITEEQLDVVL